MTQTFPRVAAGNRLVLPADRFALAPWAAGQSPSAGWTARNYQTPVGVGRLGRIARQSGLSGLGYGLGANETTNLAVSAGSIAASGAAGIASAIAIGASLTVPVIGVAIAGVSLAIQAILNSGCGQTCVITSNWANQAEDLLKQNKAAYFALPSPRSRAAQTAALANFDAIWNYLRQECGSSQVGDAGKACISDRQSGACKWKDAQGQCFNWFSGYRDPIATDPVEDTEASNTAMAQMGGDPVGQIAQYAQAGGGVGVGAGGGGVSLLLAGGLLLLALGVAN